MNKTPSNIHLSRRCFIGSVVAIVASLPVSSMAGPLFSTREEAEAALFVLEKFLNGKADIEDLAPFYAKTVDYFDLGPQSKQKVLGYRREFFSRWSSREYVPDLSTLVVHRNGSNRFIVQVEVDFIMSNAVTQLKGRSHVDVTLEQQAGQLRVVRESGKIMLQQ